MSHQVVNVHMGEYFLAQTGEIVNFILGSCVALVVFDDQKKQVFIAHCVLPRAIQKSERWGGKYIDQAFQTAEEILQVKECGGWKNFKVCAIGSAMDTRIKKSNLTISEKNWDEVDTQIRVRKIPRYELLKLDQPSLAMTVSASLSKLIYSQAG